MTLYTVILLNCPEPDYFIYGTFKFGEICAESSEGRYFLIAILKTLPVKVIINSLEH